MNIAHYKGGDLVRVMVSVSLDNELVARVDQAIKRKGMKRSAVVAAALENWLKHQDDAPIAETMVTNPNRKF